MQLRCKRTSTQCWKQKFMLQNTSPVFMHSTGCEGCAFFEGETFASISVDACKRANRSLFSAPVSSHKPLFVLLGSFKRVVCNSVKNWETTLQLRGPAARKHRLFSLKPFLMWMLFKSKRMLSWESKTYSVYSCPESHIRYPFNRIHKDYVDRNKVQCTISNHEAVKVTSIVNSIWSLFYSALACCASPLSDKNVCTVWEVFAWEFVTCWYRHWHRKADWFFTICYS